MQKHVNLVDLVKSFPTNIFLQKLASMQKRTSPVKFAHLAEKSGKGSISNLSTKVHQEAFIKALIAMEYPHDPRDGYNDLAPKTRDFVILSDLDMQAARALKENPKYAKKRKQERKAKANAEAKPPAVGALERLSAALLEKFPDRQTAWDEFS